MLTYFIARPKVTPGVKQSAGVPRSRALSVVWWNKMKLHWLTRSYTHFSPLAVIPDILIYTFCLSATKSTLLPCDFPHCRSQSFWKQQKWWLCWMASPNESLPNTVQKWGEGGGGGRRSKQKQSKEKKFQWSSLGWFPAKKQTNKTTKQHMSLTSHWSHSDRNTSPKSQSLEFLQCKQS